MEASLAPAESELLEASPEWSEDPEDSVAPELPDDESELLEPDPLEPAVGVPLESLWPFECEPLECDPLESEPDAPLPVFDEA